MCRVDIGWTDLQASHVNAFYIVNTVHDIMYQYGFTENIFNFQQTSLAREGQATPAFRSRCSQMGA